MATIKRSAIEEAADGRKLATVLFTPQVPNPASQADVEVIFEIEKVENMSLDGDPWFLTPLSCTLTDTREPYILSGTQRKVVRQAAVQVASDAKGLTW